MDFISLLSGTENPIFIVSSLMIIMYHHVEWEIVNITHDKENKKTVKKEKITHFLVIAYLNSIREISRFFAACVTV